MMTAPTTSASGSGGGSLPDAEAAWNEGYEAARGGLSIAECPWAPTDPDGLAWRQGWINGEVENRERAGTMDHTPAEYEAAQRMVGVDPTHVCEHCAPVARGEPEPADTGQWTVAYGHLYVAQPTPIPDPADRVRSFADALVELVQNMERLERASGTVYAKVLPLPPVTAQQPAPFKVRRERSRWGKRPGRRA